MLPNQASRFILPGVVANREPLAIYYKYSYYFLPVYGVLYSYYVCTKYVLCSSSITEYFVRGKGTRQEQAERAGQIWIGWLLHPLVSSTAAEAALFVSAQGATSSLRGSWNSAQSIK
jgi:hypothetical protein